MDDQEHSKMKENHESSNSNETFTSLTKDFCGYTSAHGFERIMSVKQWIRKAFWSLLFIAAITVLGIQVKTLYNKYQSRPLVTLVTLKSDTSLPFPVVTLCNFNAIKYNELQESNFTALKEKFQKQNASSNSSSSEQFSKRRRRRSGDDIGNDLPTTNTPYDDDDDYYDDDYYDDEDYDLDEEFFAREKVALLMAEEDASLLSSLGHQFEDMVLSCTFRGISCSNYTEKFWARYWHYKYGNCYVFNSGLTSSAGTKKSVLKSNKAGPSHGLNLELNIEQDEYLDSFTPEAGARIDITSQGDMPFPLERGLSIPPGFATAIGLRKVIIERQDPFENGRCHKNNSHESHDMYNKIFNTTYSSTACKESCLAKSQFRICGCMEYKYPVYKEPVCDITNKTVIICLNKVQKMFRDNKLNCTGLCPPPCWQQEFRLTSSFAAWPAENYEYYFQSELEKRGKFVWSDFGSSRKNVLKLQIFFEELNVELITEKRSYELPDFASDIGGQLGLWIGFSVLTIAEFIEFVMLLFCLAVRKCSSRGKVKSATMEMKGVNSYSNEALKLK